MRQPFKRAIRNIEREEAHGGSGARQLLLSDTQDISPHLEAMTKGFLAPGSAFDWHEHKDRDEFYLVLKGEGHIRFADGTDITYQTDDLVYIPANSSHRIKNTGSVENEFYFVRINSIQ